MDALGVLKGVLPVQMKNAEGRQKPSTGAARVAWNVDRKLGANGLSRLIPLIQIGQLRGTAGGQPALYFVHQRFSPSGVIFVGSGQAPLQSILPGKNHVHLAAQVALAIQLQRTFRFDDRVRALGIRRLDEFSAGFLYAIALRLGFIPGSKSNGQYTVGGSK